MDEVYVVHMVTRRTEVDRYVTIAPLPFTNDHDQVLTKLVFMISSWFPNINNRGTGANRNIDKKPRIPSARARVNSKSSLSQETYHTHKCSNDT